MVSNICFLAGNARKSAWKNSFFIQKHVSRNCASIGTIYVSSSLSVEKQYDGRQTNRQTDRHPYSINIMWITSQKMTAFSKLELELNYLESKLNYLLLLRRVKRRRIRRFLERKRESFESCHSLPNVSLWTFSLSFQIMRLLVGESTKSKELETAFHAFSCIRRSLCPGTLLSNISGYFLTSSDNVSSHFEFNAHAILY